MPFQPIARQTAADAIFDQLATEIVQGRLESGSALPAERALSEQLGVSRPAVREALQRLAQAGLVDIRHGGATRVRDFRDATSFDLLGRLLLDSDGVLDAQVVRSVLEMRNAIGADAARRCAQRGGRAAAEGLAEVAGAMAAVGDDIEELQRLDLDFWDRVIDGSANIAYRIAFNGMRSAYEPVADVLGQLLAPELFDHADRSALVAAVAAGDGDAAESAARAILESSTQAWRRALDGAAST